MAIPALLKDRARDGLLINAKQVRGVYTEDRENGSAAFDKEAIERFVCLPDSPQSNLKPCRMQSLTLPWLQATLQCVLLFPFCNRVNETQAFHLFFDDVLASSREMTTQFKHGNCALCAYSI
jgi:hypothetical protein